MSARVSTFVDAGSPKGVRTQAHVVHSLYSDFACLSPLVLLGHYNHDEHWLGSLTQPHDTAISLADIA